MQIQRVQKLITFSPQLYQLIEKNASDIGVTFPEYIRVLAVNDIKNSSEKIAMLDKKTEEQVGKSIEDIKNRNVTVISSEDELDAHLHSL